MLFLYSHCSFSVLKDDVKATLRKFEVLKGFLLSPASILCDVFITSISVHIITEYETQWQYNVFVRLYLYYLSFLFIYRNFLCTLALFCDQLGWSRKQALMHLNLLLRNVRSCDKNSCFILWNLNSNSNYETEGL